MNIEIIAFSQHGMDLALQIKTGLAAQKNDVQATRCPQDGLGAWTRAHFNAADALLFVGACGIAVRAIAPYVKDKTTDPAVLVIDENANFVISLLSGHIGGANTLARAIADAFCATPVITTATDVHGTFAIDTWAVQQGLYIANPVCIKSISARLLEGETIKLTSDFPIEGKLPAGVACGENNPDVVITHRENTDQNALHLIAPIITVGIGCKKGTQAQHIECAFFDILKQANCHLKAVWKICSIDLKAQEPGILDFVQKYNFPFQTFSATDLNEVPGDFTGSAFVTRVTGVDNVCERSAVLSGGEGSQLIVKKQTKKGITLALAVKPYAIRFESEDL